ncbi:hypothetical protein [Sphingobacterium sp.]|uniref:hypothetical protein n=1 Tax=Sphingobacterium sp. TaxID=341027 RepID=UPI002FDD2E65
MSTLKFQHIIFALLTLCYVIPAIGQTNVNGNLSDWEGNHFIYDKENLLYYAVKNDRENLYIAIRKNEKADKITASAAIGGIQLYIDGSGKKDSVGALNIGYPVAENEIIWDQIRINNVGSFRHPKIISVYNDLGILAASEHEMKGHKLTKYQVEYKIPLEYISSNYKRKISVCILLKGFRWKANEKSKNGVGLDFSSIADPTERESIIDKSDWSYTWFDYFIK